MGLFESNFSPVQVVSMNSAREDLFNKIIKVYPALSPKKRRVADFILKDHKKVFLMTAREIAEECSISEPTIIRFTNDLEVTPETQRGFSLQEYRAGELDAGIGVTV